MGTRANVESEDLGRPGHDQRQWEGIRATYGNWLDRKATISTDEQALDSMRVGWVSGRLAAIGFDDGGAHALDTSLTEAQTSWRRSANVEYALLTRYLWVHSALLLGAIAFTWWIRDAEGRLGAADAVLLAAAGLLGFGASTVWLFRVGSRVGRISWLALLALGGLVAVVVANAGPRASLWLLLPAVATATFVIVAVAGVLAADVVVPVMAQDFRYDPWDQLIVDLGALVIELNPFWPPAERSARDTWVRRVGVASRSARGIAHRSVGVGHLGTPTRAWSRSIGEAAARTILRLQRLAFMPSPEAMNEVLEGIGQQIVAAGRRDLSVLIADEQVLPHTWWVWRYLPRAALCAGFIVGAAVLPTLLSLDSSGTAQVRWTLGISALLSLFSPADALTAAGGVAKA